MRSGLVLGLNYHAGIDNPVNKAFVARATQKFKSAPTYPMAIGYDGFRIGVVTRNRDRHRAAGDARVSHRFRTQRIERLNDHRVRRPALNGLAGRRLDVVITNIVGVTPHGVGRVEDDLAGKVAEAHDSVLGSAPGNSDDDDISVCSRSGGKRGGRIACRACHEILNVLSSGLTRTVDDVMTECREHRS